MVLSATPAACLQVIDELSDDETPQRLHQYGVRIVTPPERLGVTYNWNIVSLLCPCLICTKTGLRHPAAI